MSSSWQDKYRSKNGKDAPSTSKSSSSSSSSKVTPTAMQVYSSMSKKSKDPLSKYRQQTHNQPFPKIKDLPTVERYRLFDRIAFMSTPAYDRSIQARNDDMGYCSDK